MPRRPISCACTRSSAAAEQRSSGTFITTIAAKRQNQSIMRSVTPAARRYSSAERPSSSGTSSSPNLSARQVGALFDQRSRKSSPGARARSGRRLKGGGNGRCRSTVGGVVAIVMSLRGCQVMRPRVPSRSRRARKFAYSLCTTCGPMSISSPVWAWRQLLARPPSSPARSSTSGRRPLSASATAQERPASPPPTITASCITRPTSIGGVKLRAASRCGKARADSTNSRLARELKDFFATRAAVEHVGAAIGAGRPGATLPLAGIGEPLRLVARNLPATLH